MKDLPTIWSGTVLPEWIDHNGHMNAGYYMVAFDDATIAIYGDRYEL